jgi:hypothetical protein
MQSPFCKIEWVEADQQLVVTLPSSRKRWGLISLDGITSEAIVAEAKRADSGGSWLAHFPDSLPVYMMSLFPGGVPPFVVGAASLELEDLDSHEISEMTEVPSTVEAHEASVASWVAPSLPTAKTDRKAHPHRHQDPATEKSAGDEDDDAEWEDDDGGEEEGDEENCEEEAEEEEEEFADERLKYMMARHSLDLIAQQLSLAIRAGQMLNLRPAETSAAYAAAGGVILSDEQVHELGEKDQAVAAFLQQLQGMNNMMEHVQGVASGMAGMPQGGGPQCQQQ